METVKAEDVFWAMVEPEEYPCDCRLWLGEWNVGGYGLWAGPHLIPRSRMVRGCSNKEIAYRIAYRKSPWGDGINPYGTALSPTGEKFDIGHICGLAPCCNPRHLMPITRSQNSKDAVVHRRMLKEISEAEREEMRASGMGFKELARTMDIPGGVAFKVLHGKPVRCRYPAPEMHWTTFYKPKKVEEPVKLRYEGLRIIM